MKTILVTNRKGGVGKTTTSVNLAAWLGLMGKSVLLIDMDTQSHVQYGLGFKNSFKEGIHTALKDNKDLNSFIYESNIENVFIIPADINFPINTLEEDSKQLERLIKRSRIKEAFDICIIDTPPTSDILLSNALTISEFAIVPVKTDFLGLLGVTQFLKLFYATSSRVNPKLELLGILPTMFNRSIKQHKEMITFLEEQVGKKRVLPPIRNDIKLSTSFLEGKPVSYFDKRTRGSKDYKDLSLYVLKNIYN